MTRVADDPQSLLQVAAFQQRLQELGWTNDANVRIEYRWGAGDAGRYRKYAGELVALASDVIVAIGASSVEALQDVTRAVPIVFVQVSDPVSRGLVASLARPRGNITGFVQFEFAMCGEWIELLKQIAPRVSRVAVLRDQSQYSGNGQMAAVQSAAPAFGIELTPIDMREADVIERGLKAFAQGANQGIIVTATAKDAIVPFPDGSTRLLHCMESPEHWFEDFGSARLTRGRVTVKLDPDFASVVKLNEYRVFLTPEGDCQGLYVRSKRGTSFEVRELRGGTSNIAFSYRIVAKRKDIKAHRRFAKIDTTVPMPTGKARAARGRKAARLPSSTRALFAALAKDARKKRT